LSCGLVAKKICLFLNCWTEPRKREAKIFEANVATAVRENRNYNDNTNDNDGNDDKEEEQN